MSQAKRELERAENHARIAMGIAIESGVVKLCEFHGYPILNVEFREYEAAYRLANAMYSQGKLPDFKSRRELTDAIKDAIDDQALIECPGCAKHRDE